MKIRTYIPLATLVAMLVAAAPANAASSGATVIADCNAHGKLTRSYAPAALQNALATMPVSVKEYSDCYDVIQKALLGQVGAKQGASTGGGSGGSALPTWLIVVIVVLALGAATLGALSLRRRRSA